MELKYYEWIDYFTNDYEIMSINNRITNQYDYKAYNEYVQQEQKIDFIIQGGDELSFKFESIQKDELSPIKEMNSSNFNEEKDKIIENLNIIDNNEFNTIQLNDLPEIENQTNINEINSKNNEIKILNDKLNSYKFQNKIILDENKKLIEIINIFRELQELDSKNEDKNKKPEKEIINAVNEVNEINIKNIPIDKKENKFKDKENKKTSYIDLNKVKKKTYGDLFKSKETKKENYIHNTKNELSNPKTYINITNCNKKNYSNFKKNTVDNLYINSIQNVSPGLSPCIIQNNDYNEIILNERFIDDVNVKYDTEIELNRYEEDNNENFNYQNIIEVLERYKEMNDRLIRNLSIEPTNYINLDKRKKDVENLEEVLKYINSIKDLEDRTNHVIPFYLIDKKIIYQNMIKYIFDKKEDNHVKRNISRVFQTKNKKPK